MLLYWHICFYYDDFAGLFFLYLFFRWLFLFRFISVFFSSFCRSFDSFFDENESSERGRIKVLHTDGQIHFVQCFMVSVLQCLLNKLNCLRGQNVRKYKAPAPVRYLRQKQICMRDEPFEGSHGK